MSLVGSRSTVFRDTSHYVATEDRRLCDTEQHMINLPESTTAYTSASLTSINDAAISYTATQCTLTPSSGQDEG